MQAVPIRLKALKPKETDFDPRTLGGHLRKRRLLLNLTQKEVGKALGVSPFTVLNLEKDRTEPPMTAYPTLIRWLGYDPFPVARALAERLLAVRRARGWTVKRAAFELGADPGSWSDWEGGGLILRLAHRHRVARLLGVSPDELTLDMQKRWGGCHSGKRRR